MGLAAMSDEVNARFIALPIKFDGTQGPVHNNKKQLDRAEMPPQSSGVGTLV
jgi:hypothetical protein